MNSVKIMAILLGSFLLLGSIIGYTIGVMSTWKTDRYYTVSGYVKYVFEQTNYVVKSVPNVHITLWYNDDPIAVVYTDIEGFYHYSFLAFEGANLKIFASDLYVVPYLVEYTLGKNNHIRQDFEVW